MTTDIKQLTETFVTLAEIDSPSGEEKAVAEKTAEILRSFELDPFIDKFNNVVVSIPGKDNLEPIILNAHLDTVEPGRGIKIITKDGLITSNGSTIAGIDDKVGVAVILETIRALFKEGYKKNPPIDVILTVHEETSTDGPRLLDYSKIKAKRGYSFDAPRPVGTITMASPFYNRFEFLIKGKDIHSSIPEQGHNALEITIKALSEIKLGKLDTESLRNIRIADGETQTDKSKKYGLNMSVNKVPGSIYGVGEVRSFLEEKVEQYTDEVKNVIEETIKNSGKPFVLEFTKERENGGFKYSADDPFVIKTVEVIKNNGLDPDFYSGFSCYDANVFAEKGVQIINVCLGSEDHHTTRERITLENLEKLYSLVYSLVVKGA